MNPTFLEQQIDSNCPESGLSTMQQHNRLFISSLPIEKSLVQ